MNIKILAIVLIISLYQGVSSENDGSSTDDNRFVLNAIIRQLFELFRNIVRNGSEEKDVPVLDPFEFDLESFETLGNLRLNVSNGEFSGLGNFDLQQFNFSRNEISIEVQLYFPEFVIKSVYYELEGTIFELFPLKGNGKMRFEMHDVLVMGKVYLKQSESGKSILVKKFENMHFTIDSLTSETNFDDNIDGIINQIIKDFAAKQLTKFSKLISKMYGPKLAQVLNTIFDKFETWNLIAVIL